MKALRNEREFLARRMGSRLTEEERERLFIKWQVPLEAKQRKLQLVNKLWADRSFWWRAILKLLPLYKNFAICKAGMGDTIYFWSDDWGQRNI